MASSQRWGSSPPWESLQRRPAARSIEPSARHALRQSLPATSSSRCEDSTSLDALWIAADRPDDAPPAPPLGWAGFPADDDGGVIGEGEGSALGVTGDVAGGGAGGGGAYAASWDICGAPLG